MVAGKTLAAFAGPFASTSVSYYNSTSEMASALFISRAGLPEVTSVLILGNDASCLNIGTTFEFLKV
jgi:hypothetical protein